MKTILIIAALFTATLIYGQGATTGKLTIHGTSNLHDWETVATEVAVQGSFSIESGILKSIDKLNVRIPVKKIKSEKGKTMDNKTYDALLADKNPNITFVATKVQITGADITATGTMNVAGKSKPATLKAKWRQLPGSEVEITGSYALKMTDFGISPPTALLGTMKTGDGITVKFTVKTKA
jgi:polyisoprenoid-binding protein YceI